MVTLILLILGAALALPALVDFVRRADFRRMSLRNTIRRPTETALIVIGSALGTAIIAAALLVGDTFDASIRDIARTSLGEIDVLFDADNANEADAGVAAVLAADDPSIDGVMAIANTQVSMAGGLPGAEGRPVEPSAHVAFVDVAAAADFGAEPERYGLRADVVPGVDEVLLTRATADDLAVEIGDPVQVFVLGSSIDLTVADVVPDDGLAGYADAWLDRSVLATQPGLDDFVGHEFAVSGTGTVFDSVDLDQDLGRGSAHERAAIDAVDAALLDMDSWPVKAELLNDAEQEGAELSTIFSVIGGFSVLAGILLLINLFVMLAEERKPNLGVLRAIGWKRGALRRAFRVEGLLYAVPASLLGALLGLGVGWVIVQLTRSILIGADPDSDFQLRFAAEPQSLLVAGLIGLIIAMLAVRFTSWRISRLNIISAIRELPEPKSARNQILVLAASALSILGGAALLATGLSAEDPYRTLIGLPLIAVGLAGLARRFVPDRIVVTVAATVVLLWGSLFFAIMPSSMTRDIDIEFFLLFGVTVVAAGVALATISGTVVQRIVGRWEGAGVGARMAMAYPTARPFRTASSLAMYSLIIFTLAFMAVMSSGLSSRSDDVIASTSAGHDVMVESNRSNPLSADEVAAVDGVDSAEEVRRSGVQFWAPFDPGTRADPQWWNVTSVEPSFATVGSPTLSARAERFATDQDALAAVASDPTLALVPSWFLDDDDGFEPSVGDEIIGMRDGREHRFEIVGITDNDYTWSGAWIAGAAFDDLIDGTPRTRVYAQTAAGADPEQVADAIESRFLERGADAETFSSRVLRFIEADLGFFSLLRGYLLLGLVIGIGGLGVTLFRAVRERRRQIGMLRAMGLSAGAIRRWFLAEATFVSAMGIVTGIGLGLLTGYFVVSKSGAIDGDTMPFDVPWLMMAVIAGIPLIASSLAALIPARRAAHLLPSEALRLAD